MSFRDHFQTTCSKVYPINLRKETCCLFSCQHPRCWESRIKWFYNKVLLIPGFPYHRSLLYGEILKNSKLFSSADFNAHPYIHTKQEMQPKSVNENHHYLQPLSEKLLHFIEQRRLCQKPCQNINQDLLVHTSNRHIGEFDHRRKKVQQTVVHVYNIP
ncbi:hypothetical protein R5R35_009141 [Gryllus longicercus]|uniref:Uncharacterized protein n=1 Tax=Gryllus longicercus TaxID=2509291 RepID=A0AAN9VSM3_9ORTH